MVYLGFSWSQRPGLGGEARWYTTAICAPRGRTTRPGDAFRRCGLMREGRLCGPPMVGRPVITPAPTSAVLHRACWPTQVGRHRFHRTLPRRVETGPPFPSGLYSGDAGRRGISLRSLHGRRCTSPHVSPLLFRLVQRFDVCTRLHAPPRGVIST